MVHGTSRRAFLKKSLLLVSGAAVGSALAACQPKVVEKIVEKEKIVTQIVETEKIVEKEVEKLVQQTVVVEKLAATPAPKAAVEIRFHSRVGEQEDKLYDMQMPKFMEANPHITVKRENFPGGEYLAKVSTMFAGGTLGDAIWGAIGGATIHFLYSQGLVREHDDLVARDQFDLGGYYAGTIKAMTLEGKLLGLPFKSHPGLAIIYYNMKLFEKAGLEVPKPEWKHEDMLTMAKAIQATAGADPIFGVLLDTGWKAILTGIRSFGGQLLSPDGMKFLLNSEEGVATLARLHGLFQVDKVSPTPEQIIGGGGQMWTTGLLGMYQAGTSGQVLKNTIGDKFKWMVVNNPIGPAGVGGSDYEVDCYSVTKPSKNVDAAWEWVKYLTNTDSGVLLGIIGGTIGGRIDAYNSPALLVDPVRPVFRDIMEKAQDSIIVGNWRQSECEVALGQLLQPLWAGQEQPTKAFADNVTQQIQAIIDKPKP